MAAFLFFNPSTILKIIESNKRVYEKIGGNVGDIEVKLTKIVQKKVNFDNLFGGTLQGINAASDAVKLLGADLQTMYIIS